MAASGGVNVDVTASFPADPETVFAMMSEPEYVSRKAESMYALSHEVDVQPSADGGEVIKLTRVLPAHVPDAVKRLVGDTITVHQTDTWSAAAADGSRTASLKAHIDRAPSTIHGMMSLSATKDGGSSLRVKVKIKGNVPFVGKKIEAAAANIIEKAALKEEEVGAAWLAERS